MTLQVLAGFSQPVLSQLLIAKHIDGVLEYLCKLKGDGALLLVQPNWLGLLCQALHSSEGFPGNALNKVVLHVQAGYRNHVPDVAQIKAFLGVSDDQHARIATTAM
ncbi:hypothetical protein D3C76_1215610 [compost metagenome]